MEIDFEEEEPVSEDYMEEGLEEEMEDESQSEKPPAALQTPVKEKEQEPAHPEVSETIKEESPAKL